MADSDLSAEEIERRKQRRRAAAATPVADEGDVAFGAMAGIGALAAVMAALFAFFGFASPPEIVSSGEVETPPVTEPVEADDDAVVDGPDLAAILSDLQAGGFEGLELDDNDGVVTVSGEVADEEARAEVINIVAAQPEVTDVIDRLTLAEPETVASAAVVEVTDDGITLTGTVPSESAAEQLRALAAQSYAADQITDELEIVEGADPSTVEIGGTLTDPSIGAAVQTGFDGLSGFTETELAVDVEADASEEINAILELEPILFQSATAIILPESQATIDEAVRILSLFPDAVVEIGGHTDSLGPEEANRLLSESRAQAVLQALRDGGVTNQLSAVGYGESELKFPDDKGDTPDKVEARQANRRIEFKTLN